MEIILAFLAALTGCGLACGAYVLALYMWDSKAADAVRDWSDRRFRR